MTPDFSMYLEMPYSLQIYNTFRNRWCGAFFANQGIKVIPTVNWSDEKSFDFCFKGIEKGSIVAVSTYMFHEHNNHAEQKDIFMKGYNKMLEEIEPSKIICYSEPFDNMKGDIIYIDYDLSSWKHLNDKTYSEYTNPLLTCDLEYNIITKRGYVCKGGGSAFGGSWVPKNINSERFLGKPNTIQKNYVQTQKGGYIVENKYNNDGKAILERHYTEHSPNNIHSNPHDHEISWDNGHPNVGPPINYFDKNVPEFKSFDADNKSKTNNNSYNPEEYKFETLSEFKFYLSSGANVGFEFNGIEYGIEGHNNNFYIWNENETIINSITLEQVLDFKLDGVKIRDLILTATITERIL